MKKIRFLSYVFLGLWFSFFIFQKSGLIHKIIFGVDENQLQISLQFVKDSQGADSFQNKRATMISFIASELKSFSFKDLNSLSKKVQSKFDLEEVRISRVGLQHLFVSILNREPILKIKVDEVRLLSNLGKIYGHESQMEANHSLPLLSGVFDDSPHSLSASADGSLELAEEQKIRIDEAIDLYTQLLESKITTDDSIQEIRFDRFRGFRTIFATSQSEILFGRSPFSDKIKRLKKLKKELEQQNKTIEKLELDYIGKAFLKEKKL